MRSEEEIQEAHDLLVAIKLREVPTQLSPQAMSALTVAASVLCWILRHDHNPNFEMNLTKLREDLTKAGYVMERRNN